MRFLKMSWTLLAVLALVALFVVVFDGLWGDSSRKFSTRRPPDVLSLEPCQIDHNDQIVWLGPYESGGRVLEFRLWWEAMPILVEDGHMLILVSPRDEFESVRIFREAGGWGLAVVNDIANMGESRTRFFKNNLSWGELQFELCGLTKKSL